MFCSFSTQQGGGFNADIFKTKQVRWVLQFKQDKCSHLEGLGMTVAFGVRHNLNSKFYKVKTVGQVRP